MKLNVLAVITPFLLILSSAALSSAACSEEPDALPRRVQFGVAVTPAPGGGLQVRAVTPGLTAASAGVREGDVLVAVGGISLNVPPDLVSVGAGHRAGDLLVFKVRRANVDLELQSIALPRAVETYPGATIAYGSTPFQGGRLRTIFAVPDDWNAGPVVYLMQGHPCSSVEALEQGNPYQALIGELLKQGIAIYRIEKPGVGDSLGGPRCETGDFSQELAGFEAGWTDLVENQNVANDQIYLLGHSMGGVDAPQLAANHREAPPRGVAVYGTVLRNFHDYLYELLRLQSFMMTGEDPVTANQFAETARSTLRRVILEGEDPAKLAEEGPETALVLRKGLEWDPVSGMMGHSVEYWRSLARQDSTVSWRDTCSYVLSLYGESDLTALTGEDAETIAHIVNHYRPGTARFEQVANADHLMSVAPPRSESIGSSAANAPMLGQAPPRPFNREIGRTLANWIKEISLAGPVSQPSTVENHSPARFVENVPTQGVAGVRPSQPELPRAACTK